ncbi:MAG: sulfotransferase [Stappiaceae bacterium]
MKMDDIDFLIIGAAKSATTWLQRSLQADPKIYLPNPELHYFSREYERGDDWYLNQYQPTEETVLIGEKSNSYMEVPYAAERVAKSLPNARLIVQLRNPVDRAYSDYCMLYRRGEVGRNVEDHLDPRKNADKRFIADGFYCEQIQRFADLYPKDRILVLLYEDVKTDPTKNVALTRAFIGADEEAPPMSAQSKVKDKTTPMIDPSLKRWLKPLKPIVQPFRGNKYFKKLHSRVAAPIEYPEMTGDIRQRLIEHYASETARLSALTGRDLTDWVR